MTDIDLTAAIKAARSVPIVDWLAEPIRLTKDEARDIMTEALPHILAQVDARVKPSREEMIALLRRQFGSFLAHSPHNPERFWGLSADAVLALLPGKTEQEVRADERQKVAMEVRKSANRLHPDAVENGAVTIDSLIGFINDLAAHIARGGER